MEIQRERLGGSFRDPSGYVYKANGAIYRHINPSYIGNYEQLIGSGLYRALSDRGWLVSHDEVEPSSAAHRTIRPAMIPYVSYAYEWCFSQLKDAALLTLDIQRASLEFEMSLKDASAYNVQFIGCKPIFIDTLSFERYVEGSPWVAYGQFCRHFLGPLALMARSDVRLRHLLRAYMDGIPLDLVTRLLPHTTRVSYGLLAHIHMHARSQERHQADGLSRKPARVPKLSKPLLIALIESLRKTVQKLHLPELSTEWGDYYDETNYSDQAMRAKQQIVPELAERIFEPDETVHDFGANTGRFSRLLASPARTVVAHDVDELAVERHYQALRRSDMEGILPLVLDLTNPSPAAGWSLTERESSLERISAGAVLALALIHHLAIGNNVPLSSIARFFNGVARKLIIEFVPKEDSQVQRMLATREDIFPDYHQEGFLAAFEPYFHVEEKAPIEGSARMIFAMVRRH